MTTHVCVPLEAGGYALVPVDPELLGEGAYREVEITDVGDLPATVEDMVCNDPTCRSKLCCEGDRLAVMFPKTSAADEVALGDMVGRRRPSPEISPTRGIPIVDTAPSTTMIGALRDARRGT